MKIDNLQRLCLPLVISLVILGTQAQAGSQCSKGKSCVSLSADPKVRADAERDSSKIIFHSEVHKLLRAEMVGKEFTEPTQREREIFEKKVNAMASRHENILEKWVKLHHPSLTKGSDSFHAKVEEELEKDAPNDEDFPQDIKESVARKQQLRKRASQREYHSPLLDDDAYEPKESK